MQNLISLSVVLPLAAAIVLPYETPNCTTFAKSLDLNSYNATLLNATYYPIHSLNVSIIFNNASFCEIYTSVSYGSGNNTLIAATWLPDRLQYNDRFMAVGNGGMAGTIDYAGMLTQLNSGMGFAVAGGDGAETHLVQYGHVLLCELLHVLDRCLNPRGPIFYAHFFCLLQQTRRKTHRSFQCLQRCR